MNRSTNPTKTERLVAVRDQFFAMVRDAPRKIAFNESIEFTGWQATFKAKIKELIGQFPDPVPLDFEIIEEQAIDDFEDGGVPRFIQQEVIFNSDAHASVSAYLLIPGDLGRGDRRPAVLCAHGHGTGKSQMVGMDRSTWGKGAPNVEAAAIHLVKEGYVVLAPDWRGFGDRVLDPVFCRQGRDPCNVTYMAFGYCGYSLLALNVWDAMRSIDVLQSLPSVDHGRIAMIGKSYGGTMTTYTTALDDRVKCAVISGYLSTLDDAISMRGTGNYCGAQYIHGLLEWGDIPDVAGLIAPRPLLIETGIKDDCFVFEDTTKAYHKLQAIYKASGHPENLDRDVADVKHEFIFHKLPAFLKKHL
nr:alpha/beta fold hydrolase [Candidatus Sigynarchaeota archaeon]